MMDRYIDIAEIVRYGQHFIAAAPVFIGLDPAVDVSQLIEKQKTFVDTFQAALAQADTSRGDLRGAQASGRERSEETVGTLRQFYNAAVPLSDAGTIDLGRFFDRGLKSSIGRSYADQSRALQRAVDAFAAYPDVKELETWAKRLSDLQSRLTDALGTTSGQDATKRLDSKAFREQRAAWSRHYRGCKHTMRGLLILVGREDEYKGIFLDLQTSGSSTSGSSTSDSATSGDSAATSS